MKRRILIGLGAAFGMTVLILDCKTAMAGAHEGVLLCIQTLIPSLFPFFFFSVLITNALTGLSAPPLHKIGKMCSIPRGAESLLAIGLLGGFPTGAQAVGNAYRLGQLNGSDASRMIVFCNNAGPSFLFGIIGALFEQWWVPWLLWILLCLSAITVGIITADQSSDWSRVPPVKPLCITDALQLSFKSMISVCGWVILFRIGITFLDRWCLWLLPEEIQLLISGFLELSNGCIQLATVESCGLRFVLAGTMLSFGGLSVTMQTYSVSCGVPMELYFPGKLFQTGLVFLCSCAIQFAFRVEDRWYPAPYLVMITLVSLLFCIILLQKMKKSCSIPDTISV